MKKFIGLFCLMIVILLIGCADNHEHNYKMNSDEIYHYDECDCGKVVRKEEHTFRWVIDVEATETTYGKKHESCLDCSAVRNVDTVIEKISKEINNERELKTEDIEFLSNREQFNTYSDFSNFYEENYNKIKKSYTVLGDKFEEVIDIKNASYDFTYQSIENSEYINPVIEMSVDFYSEEFVNHITGGYDVTKFTVSILCFFYPSNDRLYNLYKLESFIYENETVDYNYVIYIYQLDGRLAGKIYYETKVEDDETWIKNIINYMEILDGKFIPDEKIEFPNQTMTFNRYNEMNSFIYGSSHFKQDYVYIDFDDYVYENFMYKAYFKVSYESIDKEQIVNTIISLNSYIYDNKIGSSAEEGMDVPRISYSIYMVSFPFDYKGGDFTFKTFRCAASFYDQNINANSYMPNVMYIYYNAEVVAKLYYSASNIDKSYFVELFYEKKVIIEK